MYHMKSLTINLEKKSGKKYIPSQGDIVYLDFNPQSGHKQKGKRAAFIIINKVFNQHLGLAYACPITNTKRDFPFHVKLNDHKITGYVMCEQMKSLDYNARDINFVEKVDKELLDTALAIVDSILN